MRTISALVVAAACAGLAAGEAHAQTRPPRVLIDANVAMPSSASDFSDAFTYKHPYSANIPGEEASVETRFKIPRAALFEGGVLVRVYRNVSAGVGFYQTSNTNDLTIGARIPHPFFVGRHRQVEGTTPVRHEQSGIHMNAAYVVPATRRLYVAVSGGPTYFTVTQRVVKSVAITEAYPFDAATFAGADVEPVKSSGWGFNGGVDVGWMFTRNIGVGGLLRYSRATLSLAPSNRDPLDIVVGGLHAGAGARVAF
jgi:hypothetical protein